MDAAENQPVEIQEEVGLSLEELGQTYAQMINRGHVPYGDSEEKTRSNSTEATRPVFDPTEEELLESDSCPITPLTILEAVLFVGTPDGKPIAAESVATLMRGVRIQEVDQLVDELNRAYEQNGHAMRIQATGGGYQLQLVPAMQSVRERFYGRIKETRLSQSAVDCLALIAYRPGITRDEIDFERGHSSGGILNQLVRRNLVQMRREGDKKKRKQCFYPTERLLRITGLSSLEELPRVEDWN